MNETSDVLVCYELPCPSQQSRSFKRKPEDPFVVPVFLSETPMARQYSKPVVNVFGHPFLVAISPEDATDPERMRHAVTDGIARWTEHARDLYSWHEHVPETDNTTAEAGEDDMEEVKIPLAPAIPNVETVTEIGEDGAVRSVQEPVQAPTPAESDEDDIADAKAMLVQDTIDEPSTRDVSMAVEDDTEPVQEGEPQIVGPKANVFALRLLPDYTKPSSGFGSMSNNQPKFVDWEDRAAETGEEGGPLLRDGDALFAEFEPTVRDYFFGIPRKFEHARFEPDQWDTFEHPELAELRAAARGPKKGMELQECLDEFVREERLGEDDLWYCPRCKKHQQATKKFDLWHAPDVLVVHLKRFSSSRTMRDKIDTFVDFPIEGLDLEPMIEERRVARKLREEGVDVEALGIHDDGEPLVYDLFAVDEHLGGLGGGHYRAYAFNHVTEQWYHFDDSFVTESKAENAVVSISLLIPDSKPHDVHVEL
jgi:ubiquitin carboxyl-terminal hydrolase 4/11